MMMFPRGRINIIDTYRIVWLLLFHFHSNKVYSASLWFQHMHSRTELALLLVREGTLSPQPPPVRKTEVCRKRHWARPWEYRVPRAHRSFIWYKRQETMSWIDAKCTSYTVKSTACARLGNNVDLEISTIQVRLDYGRKYVSQINAYP